DQLPEALDRQHGHVPGLHHALAQGFYGTVGREAHRLGRDAGLNAAHLALLAVGALLLHGIRSDGDRLRLAVAFDRHGERLARPRADRLHQVFRRVHRLTGDAEHDVARLEAGLLRRRAGADRADLRDERRPGADVPRRARLAEDRIRRAAQPRRNARRLLRAVALDAELERVPVRLAHRAVEGLPVAG